MDDSRISITVCGDGGCGMQAAQFLMELARADRSFACREVINHSTARSEPMDARVSTQVPLLPIVIADECPQIRSHDRYLQKLTATHRMTILV